MPRNPLNFLRDQVQQHKVKQVTCKRVSLNSSSSIQDPTLASRILKITKNYIDMPALVIQWNDAGFNDVPASPGNKNGIVGQDRNVIINHLVTGATPSSCSEMDNRLETAKNSSQLL
ncbi:unnamed protein product [Rhizophagus irregularis]|uniref:Uncharacterized protein n=1 Tax=Rhizophagus irregularis TaxID=588596 RepID=A0A2I1GFR1_9GLOM|nr:hypothetical protein RhiirA4_460041 [Rhizophagus irregularis]CAB4405297.1 unnamed protein product [Rhizophagus irregularis]